MASEEGQIKKCGPEKKKIKKSRADSFVFYGIRTFLEFSSMEIHFMKFEFRGKSFLEFSKFQETFSMELNSRKVLSTNGLPTPCNT